MRTVRLLYQLSVKEKQKIIDDLYKKNGFVTIADEMWQQILDHMNWQEKKIKELLAVMAETNKKLDDLRYIVENHDLNFKTSNTGSLGKSPTEKETSAKKEIITEKGDSYGFEPLIDGEKEEIEISDSWEEIIASVNNGTYRKRYKIGNYKALDLGSRGKIKMQIAGFDADPLAEGDGRAAITWISRNVLENQFIISENVNFETLSQRVTGWKESDLNEFLNEFILAQFPDVVKAAVKKIKKYSSSPGIHNKIHFLNENEESEDYLWIPSLQEVFGDYPMESSAPYYSALFTNKADRKRSSSWWLRSAKNEEQFYCVSKLGNKDVSPLFLGNHIVIGFCT